MSRNLEYRARDRQRKGESRATSQPRSTRKRVQCERKKQRRHFLLEEQHENFVAGGDKMRNASGHQGENERQWKKKVNKNTYDISFIKRVTRKFLEVSRCSRAKKQQRNEKKKMCCTYKITFRCFFPNKADCSLFDRSCCLLRLALHDFIICYGKLSILSRASLLALATSIYYTVTITIGTFSTDGFDDGYGKLDRPAGTSDTRRRPPKSPRK